MVSVIIPAYNSKDFICDAIDSVLDQTYKNFEIIVVDDGSTDETATLLKSKYSDLLIISQKNSGLAAARNRGLEIAQGDYLQFLDADDILLPDKFKESIDYLENGYDLVSCWCEDVSFDLQNTLLLRKPFSADTNHFLEILNHNSIGVVHGPVFKKSILNKIPKMDESFGNYCADWNYWMQLIYGGYKIGIIEKVLCKYRRHPNSLTIKSKYYNSLGDKKVVKKARKIIKRASADGKQQFEKYRFELGEKIYKTTEFAFREKRYFNFIIHVFEGFTHSGSCKKMLLSPNKIFHGKE